MPENDPLIPPDTALDPMRVPVLVHPLSRGAPITCLLRMASPLGKLRDALAGRFGISPDSFVLLYDGHVVKDGDSLAGLCALGVDEDELRAGVHFEMNARQVGGALGRGRDRGRGGLCASCLCAAGR